MNERQIQIVGAQLFQAQLQARDHLARAELADPHLGGQVDILAGHAAFVHQAAHFGLVVIDLGGIDLTSSPTLALRVTGGGFPLLGDSCSRSTGFLLHRAA